MELVLIPTDGNLKRVREIWEELEAVNNHSYFLSWGWIENWISCLPDGAKPELAVFLEKSKPQLAFFLGKINLVRKHLLKSRAWFVNATGVPAFDRVYVEYNGFLCKKPIPLCLLDLLRYLPNSWEEIYFPGLDMCSFPGTAMAVRNEELAPFRVIVDFDTLSPFVDLDLVRSRDGNYLSLLSANTRSQINRSYRLSEEIGPVRLEVAQDLSKAIDIYEELVSIHEKVWASRGQEGAFCSDYLFHFHKRLIEKRFSHQEIQLLRVKCGHHTVGCLYNFVYKNNVFFYQSGLNYALDKRLKPGFMTHVEAIRYNVMTGQKTYDFLGGNSPYKRSLSTHHNKLAWLRIQKPLLKFRIAHRIKTVCSPLFERHNP